LNIFLYEHFFITLSLSLFIFQNCGDKYIISGTSNDIPSETSYETDIEFLNDLIIQNNLSILNPLILGVQSWENNRLTELEIQNNSDLYIIPSTINYLDKLTKLILNDNSIVHISSNICALEIEFFNSNQFNVSGNYLCPSDIPYCLDNIIDPYTQICD